MTIDEIIEELSLQNTGKLPRKALTEAMSRREEITPRLLEALDYAIAHAEDLTKDEIECDLPFYAVFLLAQFRETRAFPRLIALMKLDEHTQDILVGSDTICECFHIMLRDTFNGDLSLLQEVIEDKNIVWFSRSEALLAYALLSGDGHLSREELVTYMRHLINDACIEEKDGDYAFNSCLINCALDTHIPELTEDIKNLYDEYLIEPFLCGNFEDFHKEISNPRRREQDRHIDDTVKELETWAYFKEEDKKENTTIRLNDLLIDNMKGNTMNRNPEQVVRNGPKIGRNDPCPCGSGKKYKKCCLNKPS